MEVPDKVPDKVDNTTRIKRRVRYFFLFAILAFVCMQTVIPWVHEFGHAGVCALYGLNPVVNLSILGNSMSTCDDRDNPEQNFMIAITGGLVGGATAFAIGYFTRKRFPWMWVACLSIAIAHFSLAILEAFFLQFYLYEQAITGQIVGLITAVTFVLMVRHYLIMPAKKEMEHPNEKV